MYPYTQLNSARALWLKPEVVFISISSNTLGGTDNSKNDSQSGQCDGDEVACVS